MQMLICEFVWQVMQGGMSCKQELEEEEDDERQVMSEDEAFLRLSSAPGTTSASYSCLQRKGLGHTAI